MKSTSKMFQVLLGGGLVLLLVFTLVGHVVAQTCIEPPTGLVGWWPLDETSGTTATDIISGNDGTHVGGPTPVTGNVAGALSFDGIDDEVFVTSTFPFHQPGDATLEFWLNTPATGHQSVFWTRADDVDANRFNIFVNEDSTFGFDYRSPSGELHGLVGIDGTGVSIPRNTWTHLAITRTGTVYNLYVNGVLAASATDTSPDLPTATGWQMSGRGGFMYQGSLDEIALYNRALSDTEIQAIFDASSAGKCKEPDNDGDGVPNDEDDCPNSDLSPTVVIDGCNSGVSNTLFPSGCTISDLIAECAEGAGNHGQFVGCVAHVTNDLKKAGTITGQQKGAIQSCAAQADIP